LQHTRATNLALARGTLARKHIAAAGLSDRVEITSGDFFTDSLPRADVITMGMILHDWNLERKMQLIRAAYDALPEGGAFIAVEALIDDARRENVFGLLMSLNMLIEFGEAFDYSGADFEKWCREAGFKRFEVAHLAGPFRRRDCLQVRICGPDFWLQVRRSLFSSDRKCHGVEGARWLRAPERAHTTAVSVFSMTSGGLAFP
jgi:hypothetical protein